MPHLIATLMMASSAGRAGKRILLRRSSSTTISANTSAWRGGLRGRCQPASACECPHVRRHKRTHLHSVEKQGQMLAPRLRALEITIDLMVIDADLPRQKS